MLDGKRIGILVQDGFSDLELTNSIKSLKASGARVILIGLEKAKNCRSKSKKRMVTTEVAVNDVRGEEFEAIVITNGMCSRREADREMLERFIRQADSAGKVIAAIGYGPRLLISAGIVAGRRLTAHNSLARKIRDAGACWSNESVTVDGNLITSSKLVDLPVFIRTIIDAMLNKKNYQFLQP